MNWALVGLQSASDARNVKPCCPGSHDRIQARPRILAFVSQSDAVKTIVDHILGDSSWDKSLGYKIRSVVR